MIAKMEILFNPVIQHYNQSIITFFFSKQFLARNKRRIELTTLNFSNDIPASNEASF